MDALNTRVGQAYGYAVCFITVIVMLIAIKQVVDSAFDLSNPIRAEGGSGRTGRPLANFELYKMEARRQAPPDRNPEPYTTTLVIPRPPTASDAAMSDADLRKLYDAEREEAVSSTKFRATRSLVGNLLLILLAGTLFGIHWRWLKRRDIQSA
jgi:hypothetical protein